MSSVSLKRVRVYLYHNRLRGKVLPLLDTMSEFTRVVEDAFKGTVARFYFENNAELEDFGLLRDDDVVYVRMEKMNQECLGEWISFNVGGRKFQTTKSTLMLRDPQCLLLKILDNDDGSFSHSCDADGAYMIDRSPEYFVHILQYLRTGAVCLEGPGGATLDALLEEAKFYGLISLVKLLEEKRRSISSTALVTREEFAKMILITDKAQKLRCQGLDFSGVDLSKMDLSNINFTYAVMDECNLAHCNLTGCSFEHASMRKCNLDNACLLDTKFSHANLEESSMCKIMGEVGNTRQANFEGARMVRVDMRQSYLSGVNFRLANLKYANFKNSNLRATNFANADLEACDFTATDLTEVNMRGAKLAGIIFDNISTPLHNSQYMHSSIR